MISLSLLSSDYPNHVQYVDAARCIIHEYPHLTDADGGYRSWHEKLRHKFAALRRSSMATEDRIKAKNKYTAKTKYADQNRKKKNRVV